jgi:hypothetical protein
VENKFVVVKKMDEDYDDKRIPEFCIGKIFIVIGTQNNLLNGYLDYILKVPDKVGNSDNPITRWFDGPIEELFYRADCCEDFNMDDFLEKTDF